LRGNANTRLRKLSEGVCDSTLLALCGLQRLGLEQEARCTMEVDEMLPAVAQGALGVECRRGDERVGKILAALNCVLSSACVEAERAMLAAVDGSCRTPVAGFAQIEDDRLWLRALLALPDGSKCWRTERTTSIAEAEPAGKDAGAQLRAEAGALFGRPLQ